MAVLTNPIAAGWLNENSLREYPFHEGVGLRPNDSAGVIVENGWSVPNCLLVDMTVSVCGSDFDPFLYMGQMSVVSGSVTLVFFDRSGDRVMSVFASKDTHVKNRAYQVASVSVDKLFRGVVCLGDLDQFFELTPDGVYNLSPEESMIEPTCIRPSVVGVRSLRAVDSSGYTSLGLTGDVSLIAGSNIRFDYDPDGNALWVSADPNAGYSDECECGNTGQKFVRSINGISVEDVRIEGDECMTVTEEDGIIKISDTCSKPCCGCAETAFINQTINDIQTSVKTLAGNVSSLGDRLTSFITSYVLSRKTLQ